MIDLSEDGGFFLWCAKGEDHLTKTVPVRERSEVGTRSDKMNRSRSFCLVNDDDLSDGPIENRVLTGGLGFHCKILQCVVDRLHCSVIRVDLIGEGEQPQAGVIDAALD